MNFFLLLNDPSYNQGYEIGHKIGYFIGKSLIYVVPILLIAFIYIKYFRSKKKK